jgi:hypothetical protein
MIRKALLALLLLWTNISWATPPGMVTQPGATVIGAGGSTLFYRSRFGKPCGVGYKSSGQYPVWTSGTLPVYGAARWWTMGDTPDADPNDPSVCTTAQWEAKWIKTVGSSLTWGTATAAQQNQALVNYLTEDFGYSNSATWHVYYLSQSGNDSTAVVDDPTHPFATVAGIENGTNSQPALSTTVTSHFTGTATFSSGSPYVTVTGSCTGSLGRTDEIIASGKAPAQTFIIDQVNGTAGCDGEYLMTNNASGSGSSVSVTGAYQNGGVIAIRAGVWTTSAIQFSGGSPNPSWVISGSYGHRVLITSFPGEVVEDDYENSGGYAMQLYGYTPGRAACCVIVNGIEFSATTFEGGDGIKFVYFEDLTVSNDEFAGYDDAVQSSNQTKNITYSDDVCHEVYNHCFYLAFGTTEASPTYPTYCSVPTPGDFNFAQDYANYLNGASCGAAYQISVLDGNFYDGGVDGFDLLHINAWVDQTEIRGNIFGFEGGSGIDLQSGNYNTNAIGNLVFDVGSECFEVYLGPSNYPNGVSSHRWITFENNVCYLPSSSQTVWGGQSISAVFVDSSNIWPTATLTNGSRDFTVTAQISLPIVPGMTILGTGFATGTTLLPYGTDGTTGTGTGTGVSYAASNIFTGSSGSEQLELQNPAGNAIHDVFFLNNVEVVTDNGGAVTPYPNRGTNSIHYDLEYNSFPDRMTIMGNQYWSAGSTQDRMMLVSADASTTSTVPAGTYTFSGGSGCNASTGSFSICFPSNTYLASNPFANASQSIYQSPGLFDFGQHNLH